MRPTACGRSPLPTNGTTTIRARSTEFQRWEMQGAMLVQLNPKDIYAPPSARIAGTGYTVSGRFRRAGDAEDADNPQSITDTIGLPAGCFPFGFPTATEAMCPAQRLPRQPSSTASAIRVTIGDYLPTENGVMVGPTQAGRRLTSSPGPWRDVGSGNSRSPEAVRLLCADQPAHRSDRRVRHG